MNITYFEHYNRGEGLCRRARKYIKFKREDEAVSTEILLSMD